MIEFYIDEAGEKRWRIKSDNELVIAGSTEGYHNTTDVAENLTLGVAAVLQEAANYLAGNAEVDIDEQVQDIREFALMTAIKQLEVPVE